MTGKLLSHSSLPPGWFGKLPGMGDFANRRLAPVFLSDWDRWLQTGFSALREHHVGWVEHYLNSPVWLFALGVGVVGPSQWLGVLMPSVDAVGRYFPLTVACELSPWSDDATQAPAICAAWWRQAAHAALHALDEDMDAAAFEMHLSLLYSVSDGSQAAVASEADAAFFAKLSWPDREDSLWLADPWGNGTASVMRCTGLPRGDGFAQLFGLMQKPLSVREGAL